MNARLAVLLFAGLLLGCEESEPAGPDPDPEPTVDVNGFRMISDGATAFEWHESDPSEADTLHVTWNVAMGVRFVWTGEAGDSIDPGENAQLVVTPADEDFVTWTPQATGRFRGIFTTGGYPTVETSFRVRLADGSHTLANTPNLVLMISSPDFLRD